MRRGADFKAVLPYMIKFIQCFGNEDNILDCFIQSMTSILSNFNFKALPPGSQFPVANVAWVSCKGKSDTIAAALKLVFYSVH